MAGRKCGTRSAYTHGCRCSKCREAEAVYQSLRRRNVLRQQIGAAADALPVTCWCESHIVLVDPSDIKAGRTRSCGAAMCREAA